MELIKNFSKEIRRPINSILGLNEMILRESRETQIIDYAKGIEKSGKYLQSLLADIIDFAALEEEPQQLNEVDYKFSTLINGLYNQFSYKTSEKGLEFSMKISENLPEDLIGDEARLKRILNNLITNSINFTDQGKIGIEISSRGEISISDPVYLIFKIIDTGIGISEEELQHIFQVEEKEEILEMNKVEARLSLAVSRKLVEILGGTITLDSDKELGTLITVEVPQFVSSFNKLKIVNEKISGMGNTAKKSSGAFKAPDAKILIVDDTKSNLKIMELLLKRTEVKVVTVSDGLEALEKVSNEDFDAIFLDIMMPHMTGVEVLRRINDIKPDRPFPVIALTANVESGAMDEYLANGFDDYLAKPVSGATIEQILLKWLHREKIISVEE